MKGHFLGGRVARWIAPDACACGFMATPDACACVYMVQVIPWPLEGLAVGVEGVAAGMCPRQRSSRHMPAATPATPKSGQAIRGLLCWGLRASRQGCAPCRC